MSRAVATSPLSSLTRHEGQEQFNAPEAVLKGLLEAEGEISVVSGPRSSLIGALAGLAANAAVDQLLRQHNLRVMVAPHATRSLVLAGHAAVAGRAAIAVIPNSQLDESVDALRTVCTTALDQGGALGILLEDDPRSAPASCPRHTAARLHLPAIEPGDLSDLRDAMEQVLRLSRAARSPVAVIVHRAILNSSDTLEIRPNRVMDPVQSVLVRRRKPRTPRWSEAGGAIRLARRMELNRFRAMPSPGERVSVGFLAVGPAVESIMHLTHTFDLHGRVPLLQLGLVHPMDGSAIERLLERCQQVIVLEPRPGSVESEVLTVAEAMRHRGEQPATIWGRTLPADPSGAPHHMTSDADLHPSVLVRKIAHLLHAIRPTAEVVAQLAPDPPTLDVSIPPREHALGAEGALDVVRRVITDVDQWLRDKAPLAERGLEPTGLAIDGVEPAGALRRVVMVETWSHRRFGRDGLAALVQAARDDRPWVFLICESSTFSEELGDLERLARGAIPGERADRVVIDVANLNDRVGLRDRLREATLENRMTVIVVRDGPPARFDAAAIETELTEIDRLGFEPQQRLVHPADEVCAIRPALDSNDGEPRREHQSESMEPSVMVERLSSERTPRFRLRMRPLLEEVEVVRTRPPQRAWKTDPNARLTPPNPLHASQALWRAHLAGFRGEAPGVVADVLRAAGRVMGYHVRTVHDATPVGPGRRAWSQILFTRPRAGEQPLQVAAMIPFGEADLLLGLDSRDTLRAVTADRTLRVAMSDRTCATVNVDVGASPGDQSPIDRAQLVAVVSAVSREAGRMVGDFASACRTWFYTDRVADIAMLGAAFQHGLIPVTVDAMEHALATIEARGVGRAREAFEFGRWLTVDARLFVRPVHDVDEDVSRIARRMILSLSRRGWGVGSRARRFRALIHGSLEAMPGLSETEPGRLARRDFVLGLYRCVAWGGIAYAERYARLVGRLYQADRGDRGRLLTRCAVLPLAEAMLMRDPIYIATMAASSEQRRRTRQQLNVKEARGDRLERRYLTRLELVVLNRRVRADVRSSDWPARAVAFARRVVHPNWRGTLRERELREYVISLVERTIEAPPELYDRWCEVLLRLHNQAVEDRLRGMALAEVRMLVEPQAAFAPAPGQ